MSLTTQKPIVVPFDFSEHALQAVRSALKIADQPNQVHVLHVLPYLIATEPGVVWGMVDDADRTAHALEAMAEALPEATFGSLVLDIRLGDPGLVATERADELGSELIVIGSHGRTGIVRLMLGSVAERVVRLAHCSVLVVKLPPVPEKNVETTQAAQLA
jgi:nucleotide-binding universal stress UspA family protein